MIAHRVGGDSFFFFFKEVKISRACKEEYVWEGKATAGLSLGVSCDIAEDEQEEISLQRSFMRFFSWKTIPDILEKRH